MERYELLNKVLMPVDKVVGTGVDLLDRYGLYEPMKGKLAQGMKAALRLQFDAQYNLEVLGEENIPTTGGCLIASNHRSWLDVQILATAPKRRLYFVAKSEFQEWPMLRRLLDLTDSIYVSRGGGGRGLDEISQAVANGKAVVIFPEGTIPGEEDIPRWDAEDDTGLLRGHSGVVRVALATGAPIIPVGLSGTGKAFPPEAYPRMEQLPLPKPTPITVNFGKPITFNKSMKDVTREDLAKMTKEVMVAISGLMDHSREYVPVTLPLERKTEPSFLPPYAYSKSPTKKTGKAKYGVLVLHGFTSDVHCVDSLVKPLDAAKLPYRFPVLRGHGTKYQDMEGTTAADWYEDAENALLDLYKEVENVVVVGLSMGGLVSLELAARHRDKVAGVALVAAALRFADPMAFMTPMLAKVVRYWPSPKAYNDETLAAKENRNYPKFATSSFASLYDYSQSMTNMLSFVKAPIVILQSKKDQVVNPQSANIIYKKVSSKDKQLVWFEKSGHEMLLDLEAEAATNTVMDFINKITGGK
ncbi:MAG TPA: alpha/beta fold hydrolase [Myxococcota bacterium]|nr:alpha/beta fold hydrolase [Myxococcota bacterium]MBP8971442.1 alpha/beta fold hydrolase [Myxococcota bacterium]OQC43057.1 MAG: Thermostable monoacylglycerol lipase [Deltaproteobacteria bacterium ADurb.Bin058]HQC45637.1 alpha/beta fold hydrolase [Myxococcota bacterium]HQL56848.1 alpha/beta fold hydrolase [Myxococcota bacterium]